MTICEICGKNYYYTFVMGRYELCTFCVEKISAIINGNYKKLTNEKYAVIASYKVIGLYVDDPTEYVQVMLPALKPIEEGDVDIKTQYAK